MKNERTSETKEEKIREGGKKVGNKETSRKRRKRKEGRGH
jgi:hypothetical protein